jgi:hypothetical protein
MAAVDRMPVDGGTLLPSADAGRPESAASNGLRFMPDVSVGYLMAAAMALCGVFFGGLMLSAAAREAKAAADVRRNAGRWVYRMAA